MDIKIMVIIKKVQITIFSKCLPSFVLDDQIAILATKIRKKLPISIASKYNNHCLL